MPGAVLQEKQLSVAASATTIALAFDSAVTAGSTIHVIWESAAAFNVADTVTVSDGTNAFTVLATENVATTLQFGHGYRANVGAGATTITVTFPAARTNRGIIIREIGGVDASPYDGHVLTQQTNPGTGANALSTGNVTPSAQPGIISAAAFIYTSTFVSPFTAGSGFTGGIGAWSAVYDGDVAHTQHKRYTSTAAAPVTWTTNRGSDQYYMAALLLKEASGGTPGNASGAGVTDNASAPSGSATGAASASGSGVTDTATAPSGSATGGTTASGAGVTDTASAPTGSAIGYAVVVLVDPIYTGPGSFLIQSNFVGTPVAGDVVRYPTTNGLTIFQNGEVRSNTNSGSYDCFYNDGSGEVAFTLTLDGNSYAFGNGVTDSASAPTGNATGAANASGSGVTDTASPATGSASGGAPGSASGTGLTDNATAPTGNATGAASISAGGATDNATASSGNATGAANASGSGITDTASPATGSAFGGAPGSAAGSGVTDNATAPTGNATGAASINAGGVTDNAQAPTGIAVSDPESKGSGVTDNATAPQGSASGAATVSAVGAMAQVANESPTAIAYDIPPSKYAQSQDMIALFSTNEIRQLTDKDDIGDINYGTLAQALAAADVEIDGYLAGRYQLPLPTVPRILTMHACDIARYRLYDDRVTETVQKRYDNVIKFLMAVAKRDIDIGLPTVEQAITPTAGGPSATNTVRIFTDDSLKDFL
jgi:phage gp36-like protein